MKFSAHLLNPSTGNNRPTNVIVFDTETEMIEFNTDHRLHILKLGVAKFLRSRNGETLKVEDELKFTKAQTFWEWVDKKNWSKATTYLFAHNITYDLSVTNGWSNLIELGYNLESYYASAQVAIYRWRKEDKKLIGLSSTNLFPGKLASWGEHLGLPKLTINFGTSSFDELMIYCERDVDIVIALLRLWFTFMDKHDVGNFKVTTSSTSFEFFKHKFLKHKVYIHTDKDAIELERKAYHGGRVETLFTGYKNDQTFYYVDVNNMYGYILRNRYFPTNYYDYREDVSLDFLKRKLKRHAVIADVTIHTKQNKYVYKHENRLIYPVGTFRTTLTTPELKDILKHGEILEVHAISWYSQKMIFREFIDYCYDLRYQYKSSGERGYEQIMKLMINSLYGKFGQRGISQHYIGENQTGESWNIEVYDEIKCQYYRMVAFADSVFREETEGNSYNSNVAIAAHVTAYARLYLKYLMDKAGSTHVYYCDTDGFIIDQTGLQNIQRYIKPDKIGMLKIEEQSDYIFIHAPKDYEFGTRMKRKGIAKSAIWFEENSFYQEQWTNLSGLIRTGNPEQYTTKGMVKTLRRLNYSGWFDQNCYMHPWHIIQSEYVFPAFPNSDCPIVFVASPNSL